MNRSALYFLIFISVSWQSRAGSFVPFSDHHIYYEGRIGMFPDHAVMYWGGSSFTVCFRGSSVSATLKDATGNDYYYVIIDDSIVRKIKIDSVKKNYLLADHLSLKKHSIKVFKCTQWDKGTTFFYGLDFSQDAKIITADAYKNRRIEFYGNSITCGSAVEDSSGRDSGESQYENNYLSYAAITARHYNAYYSCIARSGIGLIVSWFPLTMPEMYDRLDPLDSQSHWIFSKVDPQIVVVNLLQNDSWLVKLPANEQFKKKFGNTPPSEAIIIDSYHHFIKTIRRKYPSANIICVLGNMDATANGSVWPAYIVKSVALLHDKNVFTHFFPYKKSAGHPNKKEQQEMADNLITFIDANIKW